MPLKNGEITTLSGKICAVKVNNGHNGKCGKIKDKSIDLKFYFPDSINEITGDVNVVKDKKGFFTYEYTTPELLTNNTNVFSVVVGKEGSKTNTLIKLRDKIFKRIKHINKKIDKYKNTDGNQDEQITKLSEYIVFLNGIIQKINKLTEKDVNVLAKLEYPLQVENDVASPYRYFSMFGGFRLSYELSVGSLIQGERAIVKYSVTNFSDRKYFIPNVEGIENAEANGKKYAFRYYFNDVLVDETDPQTILVAHTKSFEFETEKLNPFAENIVRLELMKFDPKDDKLIRWGAIENEALVAEDIVIPTWMDGSLPSDDIKFIKYFPEVKAIVNDAFGKIEVSEFKALIDAALIDGSIYDNKDFTSSFINIKRLNGAEVEFIGSLNNLPEGAYDLKLTAQDYAGNIAIIDPLTKSLRVDRTLPVIILEASDNVLTNNPLFNLPIKIIDHSPVVIKITQNGVIVFETSEADFTYQSTLIEGFNTFKVQTIDAAGNIAIPVMLESIELDTIPPVLSDVFPEDNSIISLVEFPVSAKSNEPLSSVIVGTNSVAINSGATFFNYTFDGIKEGPLSYIIYATDLADNTSEYIINIEIVLSVIRADLITVLDHPTDPTRILIQGHNWAARPGVEVSTGFFGLYSTYADEKGRFMLDIPARSDITLKGHDYELNRIDYASLTYEIDTTFSGLVQNLDGKPMIGVKVTIESSGQSAVTNDSGLFRISEPATGDVIVSFDGTGITESNEDETVLKIYNKTSVALTLGNNQLNVLRKPIIIMPLLIDSEETEVLDSQATTVTSAHADGFQLEIPAGNAVFPSGANEGKISVVEVEIDKLNVVPPAYVMPKTVYALEPSGVKFTEPVKLTLPNVNQFPPKTQLVIFSKNSVTGIWEIDGLAAVTAGGLSIETTEDGGITHFSEVFAAPIAPKLSQFNHDVKNGAVINNKGSSASVELPSTKILGKDITPRLIYNSSWASPKMIVSNIIAVDKQERIIHRQPNGSTKVDGTLFQIEFEGKSWVEPESVTAWASTADMTSAKYKFSGVPNNSLISYALDLKDQKSGYHPYLSEYEIQLKQMTLGTVIYTADSGIAGFFGTQKTQPYENSHIIEELFPQALPGNIIVQNKVNSSFGQGWKFGLTSQILDVQSPVLVMESESGSVQTYHADNRIKTIYTETLDNLAGVSLVSNNGVISLATDQGKIKDINLDDGSISSEIELEKYSGYIGYNYLRHEGTYSCGWGCTGQRYRCHDRRAYYYSYRFLPVLFKKNDGTYLGADKNGAVYNFGNNTSELIAGRVGAVSSGSSGHKNSVCGASGMNCYNDIYLGKYDNMGCAAPTGSSGQIIHSGFANGDRLSAQFNHITDIAEGPTSSLLVVDYGNNAVRALNMQTNTVSTFAGNRQTYDNGDGGIATNASLYHPLGITTDAQGNVYVSTERGYIRKIDVNGYISTIAGLPLHLGGKIKLSGFAKTMALSRPYGMVIDNAKNILYVADSGNNRILAINLSSLHSYVVAGDGNCNSVMRENVPATAASLCTPERVGLDSEGNLLVFDKGHKSIRKIIFNTQSDKLAYFTLDKNGSVLEKNILDEFIHTSRNGNKIFFDNIGKQTRIETKTGVVFDYFYDNEKISEIKFGNKLLYSVTYNGETISSIVDSSGRETQFEIIDGKLNNILYPDGTTESYLYDSEGRVTKFLNKRSKETLYEYNEYGEIISLTNANMEVTTFVNGQSKTVGGTEIEPLPLKDFDDPSLADFVIDPKGHSIEVKKDFTGFISTIVDQRGLETKIERDEEGKPLKVTRPDSSFISFSYNINTGDLEKRIESETGYEVNYLYNPDGDLLSTLDNRGRSVINEYDPATGLLAKSSNSFGQISTQTYTPLGLIASKTNPLGQTVQFEYGEYGNGSKTISADSKETIIVRDVAGNIISIRDKNNRVTLREYDLWNRLISVTVPSGEITRYEYFKTNELSKIIDPLGNQTVFKYDNLGHLVEKINPLGKKMFISYDVNGNISSEQDYNGNIKTFDYNSVNKVIKKVLPDNELVFTYSIQGNLTSAKNNTSQVDMTYEKVMDKFVVTSSTFTGLGSLASMKSYTVQYAFNNRGNKVATMTPFGEFQFDFDAEDRLTRISNHINEEFGFDYDNGNRLVGISRPGSITEYTFDSTNFLTNVDHRKSDLSKVLNAYVYTMDNIGSKVSSSSSFELMNYGYNLEYELTNLTHSDPTFSESFSYDNIGNRTTDNFGNFSYDSTKQQLIEDYQNLYFYDNNGNLTSKVKKGSPDAIKYFYNSENQLIGFENYENNIKTKEVHYFYGPLGKRIKKDVVDYKDSNKSFIRQLVFDGDETLAQLSGSGDTLAIYTHSGLRTDDVLSVEITQKGKDAGLSKNKGSFFYLKDSIGNIVDITDSSGEIIQHYIYSGFGKILKIVDGIGLEIGSSPLIQPYFTYTGREYDVESGLYYYRARYYEPALGRFLTVDPFIGDLRNPITFINKYIYTENNPVNLIDPSGESSIGNWHGNYCGSNISGGEGPPIDDLDRACERHDSDLMGARDKYSTNGQPWRLDKYTRRQVRRYMGDRRLFLKASYNTFESILELDIKEAYKSFSVAVFFTFPVGMVADIFVFDLGLGKLFGI